MQQYPKSMAFRFLSPVACLLFLTIAPSASAQDAIDVEISITKSETARISKIDDWFIGSYGPTDRITNLDTDLDFICVESSTGAYRLEVISQNAPNVRNELVLRSQNGDAMAYEIYGYRKVDRTSTVYNYFMRQTVPTSTTGGLPGSRAPDCTDTNYGTNLAFVAVVRPVPFNAAPPGIYQDLVMLRVSPE